MNKKKLVPEIRFKEFTDDWKQCELKSLGYYYSGLTNKTKNDFGIGNASYIPFLNVISSEFVSLIDLPRVAIDNNQNEVMNGDVLFNISSETPEEVGLSSVVINKLQNNLYLNSFCFGFRLTKLVDNKFIAFLLRSKNIRKQIINKAQGISRFNISKKSILNIKISLPKISNQSKIGNFIFNLSYLLSLHQRKCISLENVKKTLLKSMFPDKNSLTPNIRFKKYTDDWKQCNNNLNMFFIETGDQLNKDLLNLKFRIPVINGGIEYSGFWSNFNVNKPSITISQGGESAGYVSFADFPFWAGAHCFYINKIHNNLDLFFLYLTLKKEEHYLRTSKYGGSIPGITKSLIFDMKLSFPIKKEQQEISNFIRKIFSLLSLHQRKCELLEKVKKALLKKMFP